MPIFEYSCDACGAEFEYLVLRDTDTATCPTCESSAVTKKLSLPRISSDKTHARAMAAAKKRDDKMQNIQMHTRLEYEANHDD